MTILPKIKKSFKKEFIGASPSIFIGYTGYPKVSIGPIASLEESTSLENPKEWYGQSYSKLIENRSLNMRSKYSENIYNLSKITELIQQLAIASKPTDVELLFKDKPKYKISFSNITQPEGPIANLKKAKITENISIRRYVDKIISDELKANESAGLLYKKGEDVYKISTILSSGILGTEKKRLVPTRWSITAVDDLIAKQLLEKVRDFPVINEYLVFSSKYLDNRFIILLMPGKWEYENFETWSPGSTWYPKEGKEPLILEEYEPFSGRTSYADKETGGYYAARLAVVERLFSMKRQARAVVFREIDSGYTVPMGVWVVRETARNAMNTSPKKFNILKEVFDYLRKELKISLESYLKNSKILRQKRLNDFIN